jgi:hypothetical protein
MSKRARMIDLAGELLAPEERVEPVKQKERTANQEAEYPKTKKLVFRKPSTRDQPRIAEAIEVDRPYGERGDFEKVTVTLPSDVRALLLDESLRRKKHRTPDWPIAAIVREAIASYLTRKGE